MMCIKKILILINIFLINQFHGQSISNKEDALISFIDFFKTEVYKSIILSKEFKSNKKCHIIGINGLSLNIGHTAGFATGGSNGYLYNDIHITKDSISVKELRKELPKKYWIFEDSDRFFGVQVGADYIYNLKKNNIEYLPKNIDFEPDVCDFSFDIIKIYKPLDKWIDFYEKYYDRSYNSEVLIPVKYELLSNGNRSIEKEKYYLFKIKIGYNDKGKLEIFKEIISGGKEERDIIN